MKFTVGLKYKGKVNHVVVEAEDALIAALKTKAELPEAQIMYVRRQNRRGDARHPPLTRVKPASERRRRQTPSRSLSALAIAAITQGARGWCLVEGRPERGGRASGP